MHGKWAGGYLKGWPSSLLKLRGQTNYTILSIYKVVWIYRQNYSSVQTAEPHSFLTQTQPPFQSHGKGECPGNSKAGYINTETAVSSKLPWARKQMPMMICLDSRRSSPDDPGRDNQENSAHSNYIYCKFSRTNAPCLSKMITHKGEERNLQLYTVLLNRE